MVVPDTIYIIEILLYSSGFKNALDIAKKLVKVQSIAGSMLYEDEFNNDFGLRSIKAIITLAEIFKM